MNHEEDNLHDHYAVAVYLNDGVVEHLVFPSILDYHRISLMLFPRFHLKHLLAA